MERFGSKMLHCGLMLYCSIVTRLNAFVLAVSSRLSAIRSKLTADS